jgi:membrane protease YdiL (CAAX protease family)
VQVQGWANLQLPLALHYLASFGPMLAAIIVTWANGGAVGLKELWSRMIRWRVGAFGFAFAVFSPIALFALSVIVVRLTSGEWANLALLGQINYMPYLGIWALVLWLLTFGFGEETGWRGFALPHLQNGRSALAASIILWVMWIVWHLPAFFYLDTYMKLGLGMLPMFSLGVLAGAIALTWLYNTSNGSILMLALWHGVFDFLSAAKVDDGMIAAIMSTVFMLWAVLVVIVYKPTNLSREPKQVR